MNALIPTCRNCATTEALEERHGLLICRGCWTIGGLLDDDEDAPTTPLANCGPNALHGKVAGSTTEDKKRPSGGAGNTVNPLGLATQRTGLEFGMTSHYLLTSPAPEATPADLASLDQAHRERMATCECPSCIPPRIGDLLPDVLAEMRRREGER